MLTSVFSCFQDCACVILYAAENATQVALDAIQILGVIFVITLHSAQTLVHYI